MKRTELIFISTAIIGVIFTLLKYPGSSIILTLSLSILSLFYFYLSFAFFNGIGFRKMFKRESYREISQMRILGAVATGAVLSVALIGVLFKAQRYPGADAQLVLGFSGLTIILIVAIIKNLKSASPYYRLIIQRVAVIGGVALFLYSISNSQWLHWRFPNNPEYVEAVLKAQANPQDEALKDKVNEEWEKMNQQRLKRMERLDEGFED